ncbi:PLP-dependent aminotransferase family protein [Paenibacillus sp. GD4]|uniref:MocR-like pyridoxine biosynthesis transcription factor PdxR n=1 Tax=Paenibacillus sp. GD4 TaxID=3068890 RepID=UPI002796D2F9|nr:PLP-dependent aminotransferase family protein [Paenibacillus sp. GD4]MDQ1912250.1 PLP-dependent aminotransferase family protein [Paenibacillus sp. GD4]
MHFQIAFATYCANYPTKSLALYHALRDGMLQGLWSKGTRLPSTRELAVLYGLSRGTVNQVYETLVSEGYLQSETGRGTYVAYEASATAGMTGGRGGLSAPSYRLSAWADRLEPAAGEERGAGRFEGIDFHTFAPDLSLFPQEEWNRCYYAQVRELGSLGLHAGGPVRGRDPLGDERLRESIAQYLRRARGMAVQGEHVAIVGGSMQAIALLAQLLVGPGEAAAAETPAYSGIRRAIRAAGGRCIDAEVDGDGLVPADWDAKAVFVTPTRQFPTGAVLSLERRQALLRWASEREAVIVEDDYDSEFRHRGRSLEPLKALDRGERVVYVGSFTKTLLPSLRIGYAVLPPALVEPFRRAMALYEPVPVNLAEQRTLAAFMSAGHYERHLRRMKRVYSRKFALLTQELRSLEHWIDWVESDAGLHVFGWWKGTETEYFKYRELARAQGVRWSETTLDLAAGMRYGMYLNFPHASEEEIAEGIQRMKRASGELQPRRGSSSK